MDLDLAVDGESTTAAGSYNVTEAKHNIPRLKKTQQIRKTSAAKTTRPATTQHLWQYICESINQLASNINYRRISDLVSVENIAQKFIILYY